MKEGYLFKKCEIFKWQKKYCVLNKACFCCFKGVGKSGKHAQRIFLCDIVTIEVDPASVKKPFSFAIRWKKGDNEEMVIFQAASREDRSSWIDAIMSAKEKELIREKEDPQRKSMKKLTNGLRRVTLVKNPLNSGFGCFLRSDHEGRIYVDRIDEQGPLAEMGILTEGRYICVKLEMFLFVAKELGLLVQTYLYSLLHVYKCVHYLYICISTNCIEYEGGSIYFDLQSHP